MGDTLSITDSRTGKTYEIAIEDGAIRAMDLRQIRVGDDDYGLKTYDPAFKNTASCKSRITYIDGEKGILRYRGYPIEQLAEQSSYIEVAYLILNGELPTASQLDAFDHEITHHSIIHEYIKRVIEGFRYDAHPMGMFVSMVGALSTFYPDAKKVHDSQSRQLQTYRLIAKVPTLAAFAYRHTIGMRFNYPDNELSYAGNFLKMMFCMSNSYTPDPVLEKALDQLFILHADHEQNCSANAMRAVGSSEADPYCSTAAAAAALYGPLHWRRQRSRSAHAQRDRLEGERPELRQAGEGRGSALDGLWPPRVQELRPARQDHQKDRARSLRSDGEEPLDRHRPRARAHRAARRLLREAEALPECRLLFGHHLRGHGLSSEHVPRALRHPAHFGMGRAVGGDDHRLRSEDRAPAAALFG